MEAAICAYFYWTRRASQRLPAQPGVGRTGKSRRDRRMYRRFRPDRPLRTGLRQAAAVWSKGALSTGASLLPAPRRSWKSGVESGNRVKIQVLARVR